MIKQIDETEILESVRSLPVMSEIVSRGIKMLNDSDASIRDLTELISKDQAITARIIKIANSAFYGYPRQIKTLSEAIVILGFKKIRSLLITASTSKHLNSPVEGYSLGKGELWKHSYAVAFSAGLISKLSKKAEPDEAFTAGILHDIGKLVLGSHLKGSYGQILNLAEEGKVSVATAEKRLLGFHHADVGGMILEHWNFPVYLTNVITKHHHPLEANDDRILIAIVNLADSWVREIGIGIGGNSISDGFEEYILKELSINQEIKEQIWKYLGKEIESMADLFPGSNGSNMEYVQMS